ncbi:TPA: PIG-L family deacetylase [Legionella pneumophila]|nr:PIG-L family deacetylase [Legionella pneumophila]HAT8333347.1 PIG-L family deacetylase [Legionella pneumophila]HCJ4396659.1 PIG-L family deacetylase [Legionella pneumophila]
MQERIAVIAAHPDDEALGCGGSLLKYKHFGHEIHLLFMTDGISSRSNSTNSEFLKRKHGYQKALDFLKPTSYKNLSFPDNQLDLVSILEITKQVEKFIARTQPTLVLTHFWNDLNIDHCMTHRAALTACRPGANNWVKKILCFQIPSSTEWAIGDQKFNPNYYINITDWISHKLEYLKCYDDEMREFPHARSYKNIISMHEYYGACVNVKSAEAFYLLRSLDSY